MIIFRGHLLAWLMRSNASRKSPGASRIEFMDIYATEINNIVSPIIKSMLKFCIFCWMYKMLPTCEDYDKEDIGIKVTESWDEFFDVLNHSAEVENDMPTSSCSIVANFE